jgi:hypothetical protein
MSTSSKRVSVLMPSHNHAHLLDDAIASVVQQSYADFELLICDDGSQDESRHVAQAWAERDPRIQCVAPSERGSVACLNALHAAARGEFLALIGPADRFATDHLARGVERLSAKPSLVATFSAVALCDASGEPDSALQAMLKLPRSRNVEGAQLASELVASNCLHMPAAILRKAAADALDPFVQAYDAHCDWDLWLRLSLQGSLSYSGDVTVRSLIEPAATPSAPSPNARFEALAIIESMAPKVVAHYGLGDQTWGRLHGAMAEHALHSEQPRRALMHLATKAKHDELAEHEKIWLMQCLATSRRLVAAHDLAVLLHAERFSLRPETCEALDATSRALGWDLYDPSQVVTDELPRAESAPRAAQEGRQAPAP